ncbi:uncharacterized protein LOC131875339 [Cryptomeria japonica]|uniref:uncharacterized protein LOC131875339 n=1 Tax=Cryptomeria japonica TaxID=3369 RepID=UPI0027DA4D2C|nr:uncharacterized protein LOC131875339 [Cryptomeria japonica]
MEPPEIIDLQVKLVEKQTTQPKVDNPPEIEQTKKPQSPPVLHDTQKESMENVFTHTSEKETKKNQEKEIIKVASFEPTKKQQIDEDDDDSLSISGPIDDENMSASKMMNIIDPIEIVYDTTNSQVVGNSGEARQDPSEIEIIAKMMAREIGDAGKAKGDGEEGEKDVNSEEAVKEKANQIAHLQPSISKSKEDGLDSVFSLDEGSDSDPTSESEESMDDSEVERKDENVKELEDHKQKKSPEADQNLEEVNTGEVQRADDKATVGDTPNKEHDNSGKIDLS